MPIYLDANDNIIKHKGRYIDTLLHTKGVIFWDRRRRCYMYRPDVPPGRTERTNEDEGILAVPFEYAGSGIVKARSFHKEPKKP